MLVSSANRWKVRNFEASGKSFIYNNNNKGPRTDPWGTPLVADRKSESWPLIPTNCSLLDTDKIETNHRLTSYSTRCNFNKRIELITVSKAFFWINENTTAKLIVVNWVTNRLSDTYKWVISWTLLP